MGRGKIEIKKIENPTNRQVTYSKRRTGIMKKAKELTVLCDAEVSILMFSSTGKHHEYCSPGSDIKQIFHKYQQATNIDIWQEQYERMKKTLNHHKDINRKLRREIQQRMGEDLDEMSMEELRVLEQNIDEALKTVRERKYHTIATRTDTYKKKVKNAEEQRKQLLQELDMMDDPCGFVDNGPGPWAAVDAFAHLRAGGAADQMYPYRVVPGGGLHGIGYADGGSHELRLG